MFSTLHEDLDTDDIDTILVSVAPYNHRSLTNELYEILDDKDARKRVLHQNKEKGKYRALSSIQKHRSDLVRSPIINKLLITLFRDECIQQIISTDLLFINAFYRRICRAKLEYVCSAHELNFGMTIPEYPTYEIPPQMVGLLQIIRLICKIVGIESSIHATTFSLEKLYIPVLWYGIAEKLITLLGETRIALPSEREPLPTGTLEQQAIYDGLKKVRQSEILRMLKTVFMLWSGSELLLSKDHNSIIVKPATYVVRLMPMLR